MVQLVKVYPHPKRIDLYGEVSDVKITENDRETVNEILLRELKLILLRQSS